MRNFASRIEKNIRKSKKASGKRVFEDICFGLIKKTSMDLPSIVNAPTPLILSMVKQLDMYYKEKIKAMKKKR